MNSKTSRLLGAALGAGALGLCLRLILYHVGFDEKNILSAAHPLHLACLVVTVMGAVCLLLEIRKLGGSNDPAGNFPESYLRSLGILSAGCLMGLYGITLTENLDTFLSLARLVLAMGSAISMALCALVPGRFRRVHIFCRGIICVFFALDMLCRYRGWSGNPQLPDYVFQVFACALLALCSYHRLAFDTGLGKRRTLLFSSLMGLCLSLISAAGPDTPIFYLAGTLWAGACMCTAESPAQQEGQSDVPA